MFGIALFLSSLHVGGQPAASSTAVPAPPGSTGAPQPQPVRLIWNAPAGIHDCPTQESVRAAVEADVGRAVFAEPSGPTSLRVTVAPLARGGWSATLRLEGSDGRTWGDRTLQTAGPRCADLGEPLGLAMTLMVDPELLTPPPPEPPPPEPLPEPVVPRLVIENPKVAQNAAEPARPTRYSLDVGVLTSTVILPGFALGAEVGVEVAPPWFLPTRLRVAGFPHREQAVSASAGLSFSTGFAGLALCPELDRGSVHVIGVCLGVDLGLLRARGDRTRPERTVTRLTVGGAGTVRGTFIFHRPWFVRASGSLLPQLGPDRFVVERVDGSKELIFQRSPLAWALGLAVGWEVER